MSRGVPGRTPRQWRFLCKPLPDELYPSHLIRLACFNAMDIGEMLGKPSVQIRQLRDFGYGMGMYCQMTGIDNPIGVRRQMTLLRYLLCDRPSVVDPGDTALAAMTRGSPRQGDFLRVCPRCLSEEHARSGFAIWHLSQQLPLTLVCLRHRKRLSNVRCRGRLRLPIASDVPSTLPEPTAFMQAMAIADAEVFAVSETPKQRQHFVRSLHASLFKESSGRLTALRHAATLRRLVPNVEPMKGILVSPHIEFGLAQFAQNADLITDNILLSLLRAMLIMSDSPCE